MKNLWIYNSLTRQKEEFVPLQQGYAGMYVCGPTVYNDVHLGNCRTYVSFDIIHRYFRYLGYKVRYVRNITDVGHLLDDGEDRMLKGARLEKLEPMEVAHKYSLGFNEMMRIFNTLPPTIEPLASGHIIEQIEMINAILDRGYAYVKNGSVYFDTIQFIQDKNPYGQLSGRVVEELMAESRSDLKNQDEKNHPSDFAIWMKASEEHIMKWPSPWSVGFPGWHLECSAMSRKYLGEIFDIHGGGNDLKFPHHENEIAQSVGACGHAPVRYWMHTNMLLLNGRKMSKSEGNSITPTELFTGQSPLISKAFSPMSIRFFMLQAHYRSTLDITDEALIAGEKGYKRLMEAILAMDQITDAFAEEEGELDEKVNQSLNQCFDDLNDDFNVPKALASVFELVSLIHSVKDRHISSSKISKSCWIDMKSRIKSLVFDIFGLQAESQEENGGTTDGLMKLIISLRADARNRKDWASSDLIRDSLKELGIQLKDGKEGTGWTRD